MTEADVRKIAMELIRKDNLRCDGIISVVRIPKERMDDPTMIGDAWSVQVRLVYGGPSDFLDNIALITVDDATGIATWFETL